MSHTTWETNGTSFEFDLTDADDCERYEIALENLKNAEKSVKKDGKESEFIRAFCKLLGDFFNEVLGEGASEKIYAGKKMSVVVYLEVYEDFLAFVRGQKDIMRERFTKFQPNRQQRRATAKKKK